MSSKVKGKKKEEEKPKLEDKLPPAIDDLKEVEPDIYEDINENEINEEEQIKIKELEEYLQNKLKGMNIKMNILDSISNGLGNSLNTLIKMINFQLEMLLIMKILKGYLKKVRMERIKKLLNKILLVKKILKN